MTLSDLADHVCGIINQSETEDLEKCKGYLQRRHEMIWAEGLWKDSLFEYTQTLDSDDYAVTDTWLPTKKILLLPTQFTHVVAIRTDTRKLDVESSETLYRQDFDEFAATGTAMKYRLLSPVVWEFDEAQSIYALASELVGGVKADVLLNDHITQQRLSLSLSAGSTSLATMDALLSISKPVTNGAVLIGTTAAAAVTIVNNSSDALDFAWDTSATAETSQDRMTVQPGATAVFNKSQPAAYNYIATFIVAAGGAPIAGTLVGAAFAGTVTLNADYTFTVAAGGSPVLTLATTDTVAPKRQRVQLFGTVPEAAVIRVLGKIKPPTFTDDSDEPGLEGIENALIAFALADMLKRERQWSKAGASAQEGAALLEQLKKVQTVQQAYHKRFIPEGGYGDDYGLANGGAMLTGKF